MNSPLFICVPTQLLFVSIAFFFLWKLPSSTTATTEILDVRGSENGNFLHEIGSPEMFGHLAKQISEKHTMGQDSHCFLNLFLHSWKQNNSAMKDNAFDAQHDPKNAIEKAFLFIVLMSSLDSKLAVPAAKGMAKTLFLKMGNIFVAMLCGLSNDPVSSLS